MTVLKRLTRDLGFDTEIVVLPIVREESGLAMSSRNSRLSDEERQKASIIYQGLREAKIAFRNGERDALRLAGIVRQIIETEPLARLEYVAVVDDEMLAPLEKISENPAFVAVAARFGDVRLIDNIILNKRQ